MMEQVHAELREDRKDSCEHCKQRIYNQKEALNLGDLWFHPECFAIVLRNLKQDLTCQAVDCKMPVEYIILNRKTSVVLLACRLHINEVTSC
jgi:hypothetical protein